MAEIIGIPGRLQSVQAADFVGMRSHIGISTAIVTESFASMKR